MMRMNPEMRLQKVGSRSFLSSDNEVQDVHSLNGTALLIWQGFQEEDFTERDLVRFLCDNFEVPENVATDDIAAFVLDWKGKGIILP